MQTYDLFDNPENCLTLAVLDLFYFRYLLTTIILFKFNNLNRKQF